MYNFYESYYTNFANQKMEKIYFKELSYKIIGCIYEMYNDVGFGYQEKHYQKILAHIFTKKKIKFDKELYGKITFDNHLIAKYYLDFLVEGKIIIELKVANDFYTKHLKQILTYLKTRNLKLGILVLITKEGIKYKRILNSHYSYKKNS